uniref:Zinc finger protein n=1 Tax=Anopheles funestus TaxID=62324 RepID=A0A182S2J3_ANOFN
MNENCRLCLNIVNRKRTTIGQSEFRTMMETVFSFSIVNKDGLPMYVCTGCSSAVRNFFSYSLKVQQNQRYLEQQYCTSNKTESSSRVAINDSPVHHSDNDDGEEGLSNLDTDILTVCNTSLVQDDTLLELSTTQLSSQNISIHRQRQCGNATSMNKQLNSDLRYTCDECELVLSNKIQLYKHRRVHQKKECPVCNMLFRSDKIKDHFTKKHPDVKLLQADGEFRCANCQELFKTEEQLNHHLRLPDQLLIRSLAQHSGNHLPMCNSVGNELDLLPGEGNIEVKDGNTVDKERVYYCTKRYKCCKCEEKFFDKPQLIRHQRLHRTTECPMCNKILRTDRIKQHIATLHRKHDGSPNELFKCMECKKLFENASQLTLHRITHKKMVCPVCKETASSSHIQKHLKSFNSVALSEDSSEFTDCMDETDTKRLPIQCDECGRAFLTKYQLRKHLRVHLKKKCPVCQKLVRSNTILAHIASKHSKQRTNVVKEKLFLRDISPTR